jgi:hypothetical protein
MLSNTKCKQILNRNGVFYTDEEIVLIKNTLYKLAEVVRKIQNEKTKSSILK